MKRVIVVGDLQGCRQEAETLLERVNASAEDWVIFAGDLVDRGPDSAGCVDLAMRVEARQGMPSAVMGNHEDKHLSYWRKFKRGKDPNVQVPSHIETRKQLKEHHYEWLSRLPLFIRVPEHNAAVVHAGCYPGRTIEQQEPHHLLHIQAIQPFDKDGRPTGNTKSLWPSKVPPEDRDTWRFWTNFWDGPERIIFGHSVLDQALLTDRACGIDGGCCFGEELRAVVLPEWRIVTVSSVTKGSSRKNAATGHEVMKYPVQDGVCTFS